MKYFLFTLGILLSAQSAFACRCIDPNARNAYLNAVSVAYVRIKTITAAKADSVARAEADILEEWKSDLPDSITIFASSVCEYPLQDGGKYLLYLSLNEKGNWTTAICSGNLQKINADARIKWLRRNGKSFGKHKTFYSGRAWYFTRPVSGPPHNQYCDNSRYITP